MTPDEAGAGGHSGPRGRRPFRGRRTFRPRARRIGPALAPPTSAPSVSSEPAPTSEPTQEPLPVEPIPTESQPIALPGPVEATEVAVPEVSEPEESQPQTETAAVPGGYACDAMLGRLAKELRLMGMDVVYDRMTAGMSAYRAARAAGRVLLTRNKRLGGLPGAIYISSQDTAQQVAQVRGEPPPAAETAPPVPQREPRAATHAPRPEETPFGRCLECNSPLEKISREQARPAVPFFVYQIHHDFRRCPKCRKVFWPGNHVQDMQTRVRAHEGRRPGHRPSSHNRPRR